MYVENNAITFTLTLGTTDIAYAVTDLDLTVKLPDKTIEYDDNLSVATMTGLTYTSFTAPTSTVEGEVVFSYLPLTAGLYEFTLATGTAVAHTEHSKIMLNVMAISTTKETRVQLP